ncbi:MAG TPA: NYN domain-containing protein [Candidatus Paceibacterota bacterium]|nr:NYN domain-containing protein [Candidatus Paceibacterota bacterium]HMO82985.1 NYN domain-containing protein [Candidatus Paceibacterota bacterium]
MNKELKNVAYIDNTNLYKGCEAEGFLIDYTKFRIYLKERLGVGTAYIFIGYVPGNEERYRKFQEKGYTLIFKPTLPDGNGKIKGNCDAELVLQAVRDYYENNHEKMILVSSDGDFGCLVQFLQERGKLQFVLSPRNKNKCSSLIKRLAPKITFLPEVKHLIQRVGD